MQNQRDNHSHHPLVGLPARRQDLIQLAKQAFSPQGSIEDACKIIEAGALWLNAQRPEAHVGNYLHGALDPHLFSLRFQASTLTMDSPCMVNASTLRQAMIAACLQTDRFTAELFELNIGWAALSAQIGLQERQEEPPLNNLIYLNQDTDESAGLARQQADAQRAEIEILKQALSETKRQLDEALKQQQADAQEDPLESELQSKSAQSELEQLKVELAELRQSSEEFRKQSVKALASHARERFDLELELQQVRELLNGDKAIEQRQIITLQQLLLEAQEALEQSQAAHQERERELESSRQHLQQENSELNEALKQELVKSQALQEQLSQAQEMEKQHATEDLSRLNAVIEDLNTQLEKTRIKASRQRKKHRKLTTLLNQKHMAAEQLHGSLQSAKEEAEITNKRLVQAELTVQELLSELQLEIKASHEAWEKASERDIAMQEAKLELTYLKEDLEQEIANLWMKLEHQEENSNAAMNRRIEENERLRQSLSESESKAKAAETTIDSLKRDRQLLREAKSELEQQLSQLEAEAQARQATLSAAV